LTRQRYWTFVDWKEFCVASNIRRGTAQKVQRFS